MFLKTSIQEGKNLHSGDFRWFFILSKIAGQNSRQMANTVCKSLPHLFCLLKPSTEFVVQCSDVPIKSAPLHSPLWEWVLHNAWTWDQNELPLSLVQLGRFPWWNGPGQEPCLRTYSLKYRVCRSSVWNRHKHNWRVLLSGTEYMGVQCYSPGPPSFPIAPFPLILCRWSEDSTSTSGFPLPAYLDNLRCRLCMWK